MYPRDRRVGSWNELQDELSAEAWNPKPGRYRSRFALRGPLAAAYTLAAP